MTKNADTCKGDLLLGTACQQCDRCRAQRSAIIGKLDRLAELEKAEKEAQQITDAGALTLLAELGLAASRPADGSRLAAFIKAQTQSVVALQRALWLVLREHCGGQAFISLEAQRHMNPATVKLATEPNESTPGLTYRAEGGEWPTPGEKAPA